MTAIDAHVLLRAFCDELARCGMTDACTSPGSRCAPLVLALVRQGRLRCWSHLDERCAGFFALGLAKADGRPAAVACTSGTAAANLAPAVHEAREARVPLIVLTADRPPELREVGAGQTIDQLRLYGTAAKWFFEVGVHEATPERLRWMRALACRAYWTALQGPAGVVHLNFPLREPLVPDGPLPDDSTGRPAGRPWARPARARGDRRQIAELGRRLIGERRRGVVVAGRLPGDATIGPELAEACARAGLPLLADPLSGARRGSAAIAHYDALLRVAGFRDGRRPEVVVRFGDLPTSKPLREWLAGLDEVPQVAMAGTAPAADPAAVVGAAVVGDPAELVELIGGLEPPDPGWLASWREGDARAAAAIERGLAGELSEPLVAAELGRRLPPEATLVAASSMPVRDVETFFPARDDPPRVLANRGANGIDGTVSTAFGVAAASAGPVVLLIGDVALAHDVGGLLCASRLGLKITVVLLNNYGGGIFHFLPVAAEVDVFEEHVATPHGLDFGRAATLYGCDHERLREERDLEAALGRALRGDRTTILEVRTDREANLALHRRIWEAVARATGRE
jgi:2-succinyl-5-enolpyruvyl-6-hydroxy-3-cyclohexene-1-carboxylate synthase